LKFVISKDATRKTKVKTELLGRKYGWKIPIIEKPTGGILLGLFSSFLFLRGAALLHKP